MKFGAFFLATSAESEDPKVVYDRASEYIVSAETLNFDSLWFAEHHFSNYGYIPLSYTHLTMTTILHV